MSRKNRDGAGNITELWEEYLRLAERGVVYGVLINQYSADNE